MQGAVTVARRVAEERAVELGGEVGYAVRFEDRTSSSTRIKYLTGEQLLAASDMPWELQLCWLYQQRLFVDSDHLHVATLQHPMRDEQYTCHDMQMVLCCVNAWRMPSWDAIRCSFWMRHMSAASTQTFSLAS